MKAEFNNERKEKEANLEIDRRSFILSLVASFLMRKKDSFAKEAESGPLPKGAVLFAEKLNKIKRGEVHEKMGKIVWVEDIMKEKLPIPDPKKVLGADRGLVISKRFHRFWLFDEGKLVLHGPVGTAYEKRGYKTPVGKFRVLRKEGKNYSSKEYPPNSPLEPNMPWAVFFTKKGHAFHGAPGVFGEFNISPEPEKNPKWKLFMRLDVSHGCANALTFQAKKVNKTLKPNDPIVVLP